jgi:RNA polymerase sigma factor (sigma-70 family)
VSAKIARRAARLVETARDPSASLREQHQAFGRLVERHQHLAFGLALSFLHDVEGAKDAVQEAFTSAWLRLRQLRDPAVFEAWLRSIVASQCKRQLRRRAPTDDPAAPPGSVDAESRRPDYQPLVASALAALPEGERRVTVLYYFLGYTQPEIARLLRLKPGTVGKRLHSARQRIRRSLPPAVRGDFVRLTPSRRFVERVRLGLFDEYVGEYRFERRPDHRVSIVREGDLLIGEAGGQRNVLASVAEGSLLTGEYDGEGRFRRDRRGRVTHFVYYEFGKRLGIARKVDGAT